MKILFDQGTPAPLRFSLSAHDVRTASEMGWEQLTNGELIRAADASFDLLITTDQDMCYQQNLKGKRLAIIVLTSTNWLRIKRHVGVIINELDRIEPGTFITVDIPI